MTKKATNKELLAIVETRLANVRRGYQDPDSLLHNPQLRDCMYKALGEISALEEVRLVLRGLRRTFICP
jgi:predicted RNA-binding protein with EMAP domain